MQKEFYAHSLEGRPQKDWQKLGDHLKNVAEIVREFAEPFGDEDCALFPDCFMI